MCWRRVSWKGLQQGYGNLSWRTPLPHLGDDFTLPLHVCLTLADVADEPSVALFRPSPLLRFPPDERNIAQAAVSMCGEIKHTWGKPVAQATIQSSFSPLATILNASSGNGRCNPRALGPSAVSQRCELRRASLK